MKVFGREPALIIGFIGAVMTVLAGLGIDWLSAGAAVAITALITAGITAVYTRPVAPSLFVGVVVAAGALLAEYGIVVPDDTIAAVGALVIAGFALFGVRAQVTPVDDQAPIAPANGQVR